MRWLWRVGAAFGALAFMLGLVLSYDRAQRDSVDPILSEVPNDLKQPFSGTEREARLRRAFPEPLLISAATQAAPTLPTGHNALFEGLSDALVQQARRYYATRCASCHGGSGDGKGPGADMIRPRPRNFADAAWQSSVTDDDLKAVILKGGAAVGKSYMMPASYDLRKKPELTQALTRLVRSFDAPK
ncbi:MAG TPA: c-type cytochrome [Polyangiaceae bacterium]